MSKKCFSLIVGLWIASTAATTVRAEDLVPWHGAWVTRSQAAHMQAELDRANPEPTSQVQPNEFGTSSVSIYTIGTTDFQVRNGQYSSANMSTDPGNVYWQVTPGQTSTSIAGALHLPSGVRILFATVDYFDNSDTLAPDMGLWRFDNSGSGARIGIFAPWPFNPGGYHSLASGPIINGEVNNNQYQYVFLATLSRSGAEEIRLVRVRIHYRREVSFPPQNPTFGDVSNSHRFYRFIEALAASGITAGCGNGNFCPNDPVTRGQMAVFLASALGLHWAP